MLVAREWDDPSNTSVDRREALVAIEKRRWDVEVGHVDRITARKRT